MIRVMLLSDIIIHHIGEEGPISFHDFMEMALYHPNKGYYTAAQDRIGQRGDFYTSSSLTPAFGAMIGRQLEEMWKLLGTNPFTVVECGAGTGTLARDILAYLKENKKLYAQLNYCIIEKSPAMREKEKAQLPERVSWLNGIQDLPEFTGCILSNELLDNFPVHQVVMEEKLMEVFVGYENGFVELLQPASRALADYLAELHVVLPKGFRTEINLGATQWIKQMAASLKRGYVLTIDYGDRSGPLYSGRRNCGTVLCYHKHTISDNPYLNIGEQDITTHVNFSALCHWGFKNGLLCCGLTSQASFLLALGFKEHLRKTLALEAGQDLVTLAKKEALLSHTLLVDMGLKLKVLIQRKAVAWRDLLGLKLW
jgi:SAM-dependent MidA family methyltransferase